MAAEAGGGENGDDNNVDNGIISWCCYWLGWCWCNHRGWTMMVCHAAKEGVLNSSLPPPPAAPEEEYCMIDGGCSLHYCSGRITDSILFFHVPFYNQWCVILHPHNQFVLIMLDIVLGPLWHTWWCLCISSSRSNIQAKVDRRCALWVYKALQGSETETRELRNERKQQSPPWGVRNNNLPLKQSNYFLLQKSKQNETALVTRPTTTFVPSVPCGWWASVFNQHDR